MTINEAILIVSRECPNMAARLYASRAMEAAVTYGTKGLKVQVRYILANTGHWRGDRAREVKAVLRAYLKERR